MKNPEDRPIDQPNLRIAYALPLLSMADMIQTFRRVVKTDETIEEAQATFDYEQPCLSGYLEEKIESNAYPENVALHTRIISSVTYEAFRRFHQELFKNTLAVAEKLPTEDMDILTWLEHDLASSQRVQSIGQLLRVDQAIVDRFKRARQYDEDAAALKVSHRTALNQRELFEWADIYAHRAMDVENEESLDWILSGSLDTYYLLDEAVAEENRRVLDVYNIPKDFPPK